MIGNSTANKQLIKNLALKEGFSDVRFVAAEPLIESEKKFLQWRNKNYAADMNYLLRPNPMNARPASLLDNVKTIIMLTANYYTEAPTRPSLDHGRIAAYAVGLDYHKILRKKIKRLINHESLKDIFSKSRFFTDSVPLLEKSFAKKAGLGFRGKNTLLISKQSGSYSFIAEIITDIEIEPDLEISGSSSSTANGCGSCVRCLDVCPTQALLGVDQDNNSQINAGLCISYLTIENRGIIQEQLRPKIGEWLFGCDLCQIVCPYNKKSLPSIINEFKPESGVGHWLYLPEILSLDGKGADEEFHRKFSRTPLARPKRRGLIRNALIVAANSKSPESYPLIEKYLAHEDQMLSETAAWAISKYSPTRSHPTHSALLHP